MSQITLKHIFKNAQKNHWAIGQFNFSTLEQLRAIFCAGESMKSPIILGTSEKELEFFGLKEVLALKEIISRKYSIPAFLNLDHGKNIGIIKNAIDMGYDAVHYDGSELSFEENVKKTTEIVQYAKKRNVLVEGELGYIKGQSIIQKKSIKIYEKDLTNIEQVKDYVRKTKVDSLAIAIGNVHGIFKKMPALNFAHLQKIKQQTNVFLVLHGASGIKNKDIKKAVKLGIVKINFNTELRKTWKDSFKRNLAKQEIKPYKIIPFVENDLLKAIQGKIIALGSKNVINNKIL